MPDWKDEVARLDIAAVAERLGLQLAPGRRSPRLALCPFHDDSTPSLRLYQDADPHYHCFACHAHGDTVELVKQRLRVDFPGALEWLNVKFNIATDRDDLRRAKDRREIRRQALDFWRERNDSETLQAFARARRFPVKVLLDAGLTIGSVEAFLASLRSDRAAQDDAVAAGLAHPADRTIPEGLQSVSLSPFARGHQVLIPLADVRGRTVGFMARQLGGDGPKYRFTTGLKKSDILYRGDMVRRQLERRQLTGALDGAPDRFDLCICEGVFDALRLEAAGLAAVATLGATISDQQLEVISDLAREALEVGALLRVHLFYDADKGGRRGVADSLPRLLKAGAAADFLVDVVGVDRQLEEKVDPDILLADREPADAAEFVTQSLISPIDALAAISLDRDFAEAQAIVANLDPAGSIMLQNRLARRLQGLDWPRVWRKLAPDRTTLSTVPPPHSPVLAQTYERLAQAGDRAGGTASVDRSLPEPFTALAREEDASLLHALILARESTDSREYPVDVAAWDRIEEGAQLFLPLVAEELARPDQPKRPYLAHYEPKESGAPRLKCGPCPEEAVQQQYVLSELLRIRPDRRDLGERIPAVRYWADHPSLIVTGVGASQTAVSFAYQIDMRALEERPDRVRRRDMFRPFLDCWNSFILHIGNRIDRMRSDLIYIARLDVKGFYDNIPRHAVERVLREALPETDTLDTLAIAPLFGAKMDGDRRHRMIDWILDHSFGRPDTGYEYALPSSGVSDHRGGSKGLPQGPVLSSYLANIVLFGLDADLEARIRVMDETAVAEQGPKACGGLYARYVDDIVIAAPGAEELRALRSAIEARLEPLGLELNEKSEHLEPMTADEARNWVVERRGAGFIGYGDVEDQPSPAPDVRTGWSDIPTLDRRTALSLLYWSALDDPEQTPRNEFEEMLDKVARANALRPTDLGHIARRIGLRAALDALSTASRPDMPPVEAFLQHFRNLFDRVRAAMGPPNLRVRAVDLPIAEALGGSRDFFAALAGLERLILGNPEGNPTFTINVRNAIASARTALLEWILNDHLLARLQEILIPAAAQGGVERHLRAQIEIQRASLEERAARTLRIRARGSSQPLAITRRRKAEMPSRSSARSIRIGWLRTFAPDGLANLDEADPSFLFHVIAAEVQAAGGRLTPLAGPDDLTPVALTDGMKAAADAALSRLQDPAQLEARNIAVAFRGLAGHAVDLEPTLRMRAISAFLGLSTGPLQTHALERRPALVESVAQGAVIIPLPPIPDQPGLFCYHRDSHTVQAVIVADQFQANRLPPELEWTPAPAVGGLQCWSAPLPSGAVFLLDPHKKERVVAADLETIADVFDGLIESHSIRDAEETALVHVFALIGPQVRDLSDCAGIRRYFSLSWRVPRAASEQLIFERRGDAIATQRSPHAGAELWRIGQAVSDLFSIAVDTDDDEGLKLDYVVLQDRLKRVAFSRLRGRWINGVQVAAALATREIPRSLKRIINALRESAGSDADVGPLALEFLLSGRAMRCRMNQGSSVDVPGGWARYLETVGSHTLRSGDDAGLFSRASVRDGLPRSSRALARAGDSISMWANRVEAGRCRQVLEATALGFEIAALRGEVRDLVLAALARMSDWDRDRMAGVRPDLSSLGSFGEAVLVEPRFGGPDARAAAYDLDRQAEDLLGTLFKAISLRALPGRAGLERITTAGWLTILGLMTGAIDFGMKPHGPGAEPSARPSFFLFADTGVAAPIRALATRLLGIATDPNAEASDAWPWEVSRTLDDSGLRADIALVRASVDVIAGTIGLMGVHDPDPLRMLTLSDQDAELITAAGVTYRLPWWRCSLATTNSDRLERPETAQAPHHQLVRPYSALLDSEGRLLVIQLLSESLSTVTGLREAATNLDLGQAPTSGRAEGAGVAQPAQEPKPASEMGVESDDLALLTLSAPNHSRAHAVPVLVPPLLSGEGQGLAAWRERQHRSWKDRGEGAGIAASGYGRIAILQYNFVDTYYPEDFTGYRLDGKTFQPPRITAGPVDLKLSFEEHRRRQVLSRVLACCSSFGVETLILPEYSAWPETINWLEQLCRQQGHKVSIWAGTFRQQHGFELALTPGRNQYVPVPLADPRGEVRPMQAILSVLFRESQAGKALQVRHPGQVQTEIPIFGLRLPEVLHFRPKKYPSIGMYEDFKPTTDKLLPLMTVSRSLSRIESFITELICSELFVFNGPLNWVHLGDHLAATAARYNLDPVGWIKAMIDDTEEAAQVFSGKGDHKPRRSILFLPCATSRDADYTYFAQNAYLASGIVTAFCNASHHPAVGGSCFIGAGGWETRGGAPVSGPYHGAAPGILSINSPGRGVLGPTENALVIADVQPDHTVEGRPRSQTLGPPMRLVAHIPILEDYTCEVEKQWDARWWRSRRTGWLRADEAEATLSDPAMHAMLLHQCRSNSSKNLDEFADQLTQSVDQLKPAGTTAHLSAMARDQTVAMALSLANLFTASPGMKHRAAMMTRGLLEHPERLPCPALLDWLIVDLDVAGFEARLRDLKALPEPVDAGALPPGLRDAAWRWVAPEAHG